MIIDFTFFVSPTKLIVKVPSVNFEYQAPNVVGYDTETLKIISIGESETDIEKQMGLKWEEIKHKIGFNAAFGIDDKDFDFDIMIIDYYLFKAHEKARKTIMPIFFSIFYIDRYDCNLWIEGYENLSLNRRLKFEYYLQSFHKVRKLAINGYEVQIPDRKRIVEGMVRSFISILPYVTMLYGLFLGAEYGNGNYFIPYLIALFFMIFILAIIGITAWMLIMRRFLPRSYLRYIVPTLPLQKFTSRLSERFLSDG